MSEKETKKQNVLGGAIVLVVATALVKVIGAIYKIPLTSIIGSLGRGYFASAYNIYTPIYTISMAGLPVAVSTIVSRNVALGKYRDVKQVLKVTFPLFLLLGLVGTGAVVTATVESSYTGTKTSVSYTIIILGDVNGDGKVGTTDAAATLSAVVNSTALSEIQVLAANINNNARLDIGDAALSLNKAVYPDDYTSLINREKED